MSKTICTSSLQMRLYSLRLFWIFIISLIGFNGYAQYCVVTPGTTSKGVKSVITTGGVVNINNQTVASNTYSDFTAMSVANFIGGTDVAFTVLPFDGTHGIRIWIDWNNNSVFDDAEMVYNSNGYVSSATGTIAIPAGTAVGNYRMRIVANWLSGSPTPCGNLNSTNNGEAEDYTFAVIAPPTCMPPTNVTITNINVTSASIGWTAAAGQNAWEVLVLPAGSPAPTETTTGFVPTTQNPYLAQGLTANTAYDVYVRANCGATDGKSYWTFKSFKTACSFFGTPFYEGFNSNSTTEDCWRVLNANNDTDAWDMNYTSNPFEGNQSAMLYTDGNAGNNDDWLISPLINLSTTPGAKRLKFHYRVQSSSEPNDFRVMLSTNGTSPADFTETLVPLATYSNTLYVEKVVVLENAAGVPYTGNVNIAFHVPPGGVDGWRLYIDNVIIEDLPPCQDVTDITICPGSVDADVSWTPGGAETSWEYVVSLTGSPMPPGNGTIVTTPGVQVDGLAVNQQYDVWIRAVCPNNAGYSSWKKASFLTSSSNLKDANPFCAGPEGIVFPNVHDGMNVPNTVQGQFHCLGSTPNPVWYYLKIETSGPVNFQIVQNTSFDAAGNPTGTGLDVDFAAFGPFNSVDEFCQGITIAPGSPAGNPLIACSYSAAPIENFSIPNAQAGQIYALLITNFNGDPGFIKLIQTNANQGGAGATDCSFLCEVDLGDDIIVCEGTPVELTAETSSAGGGSDIETIEWFKNDQPMDPAIYNTETITVTESGTYKVKISKEKCTEEFVYDEVNVQFVSVYSGQIPTEIVLCDHENDNQEPFDLAKFITDLNLPAVNSAHFYATLQDANQGNASDALSSPYVSGNATIYLRVESTDLEICYSVYPVNLILTPVIYAVVDFSYQSPVCYDSSDFVWPNTAADFTTGGVFSSTAGLAINAETGQVDVKGSQPGTYEVTYKYVVPEEFCGDNKEMVANIVITEPIKIDFYAYCSGNKLYVQAINSNPMTPNEHLSFEWSSVESAEGNTAIITKEGKIEVKVTDTNGCEKRFEFDASNVSCMIAKGISPNGDGLNDAFDLSNYDISKISIFNRHGKEVFSHGQGYRNEWIGQDKSGKELPSGTYYYHILTKTEEITGYIQLVREVK